MKERILKQFMLLEIDNVSKKYRNTKALDQVSIGLEKGVYGVLGANGAGKTTLANIIIGVIPQTSGVIRYNGTDIRKLGKRYLADIGYMPQNCRFYQNFTVSEFLGYMCRVKDIPVTEIGTRIEKALHAVNLQDDAGKKIQELSGGMRQRVGIAQAILNDPMVLILDEPTAGLDPAERIRFRNIISSIAKDRIVIITTHIVSDIEFIANQVMIFDSGHLKEKGTIADLCGSISDEVWEASMPEKEAVSASGHYLVSGMRRENDKVTLRIISSKKPSEEGFSRVTPHLEDVFLEVYSRERGL